MELIYPVDVAPLAPGARGPGEMLPVVEPSGQVIARAPRSWCHGGSMLLHPVVHLHILDRYGRFYLQRRSALKHRFPCAGITPSPVTSPTANSFSRPFIVRLQRSCILQISTQSP